MRNDLLEGFADRTDDLHRRGMRGCRDEADIAILFELGTRQGGVRDIAGVVHVPLLRAISRDVVDEDDERRALYLQTLSKRAVGMRHGSSEMHTRSCEEDVWSGAWMYHLGKVDSRAKSLSGGVRAWSSGQGVRKRAHGRTAALSATTRPS